MASSPWKTDASTVIYFAAAWVILIVLAYLRVMYIALAPVSKSDKDKSADLEPKKTYATREEEIDADGGVSYYSAADVAAHSAADDCWIIVDGKVYDVSSYVEQHMGGEEALLRYAGKDASEPIHGDQHPLKVREILDEFYIGRLQETKKDQ
eukprot:TRINITY_DN1721_c0_g1_i1.p1 TRINITY_DN1721_c0_g1~~TRINITY_DN1721_c0_g1_i1.p1  ORF type:complete len:152 (+),score=60.98 TRINITY_DN1721_c0_g1_i1:191-646(+)